MPETKVSKTKTATNGTDAVAEVNGTALAALVADYAETVAMFADKTHWRSNFERPYRPLLALGQAVAALAQVTTGANGNGNADVARELANACLHTTAGRNRALRNQDHHFAAVTARVVLALWGAQAGEPVALEEAQADLALLRQVAERGRG